MGGLDEGREPQGSQEEPCMTCADKIDCATSIPNPTQESSEECAQDDGTIEQVRVLRLRIVRDMKLLCVGCFEIAP